MQRPPFIGSRRTGRYIGESCTTCSIGTYYPSNSTATPTVSVRPRFAAQPESAAVRMLSGATTENPDRQSRPAPARDRAEEASGSRRARLRSQPPVGADLSQIGVPSGEIQYRAFPHRHGDPGHHHPGQCGFRPAWSLSSPGTSWSSLRSGLNRRSIV